MFKVDVSEKVPTELFRHLIQDLLKFQVEVVTQIIEVEHRRKLKTKLILSFMHLDFGQCIAIGSKQNNCVLVPDGSEKVMFQSFGKPIRLKEIYSIQVFSDG
jgi:hypothetical protein